MGNPSHIEEDNTRMVTRKGTDLENKPCAINPDRQQKRLAAKKCTSYSNKVVSAKPNYRRTKKLSELNRKRAHHTRLLEKHLAACTIDTVSESLGFYDGFIGSDRDFIALEDSEFTESGPFLPDLNINEDDDDMSKGDSDEPWMCSKCAREARYENLIAHLENEVTYG